MRRACVSTVRSPSPTLSLLPRGWGAAPLARSTPTRAQRGTRPKKYLIIIRVYEQKFLKESTQIYFILIFNVLDVKVES
ncbi:MAG: hypothetical protein NZ455_03610 [Bacteroidia bacterium]|nr:hypothetical protein [Bacteroidia bacterium]